MVNAGIDGAHLERLYAVGKQCREHFTGIALVPMGAPDVVADFDLGGILVKKMVATGAHKLLVSVGNQGKALKTQGTLLIVRHDACGLLERTSWLTRKPAHLRIGELTVDGTDIGAHERPRAHTGRHKHGVLCARQ